MTAGVVDVGGRDEVDDRARVDAHRRERRHAVAPVVDPHGRHPEPVDVPRQRGLHVDASQHEVVEALHVEHAIDASRGATLGRWPLAVSIIDASRVREVRRICAELPEVTRAAQPRIADVLHPRQADAVHAARQPPRRPRRRDLGARAERRAGATRRGRTERFFRPPYVGGRGWIGLRLDIEPDWDEVASIVDDAYRLIAPKKLVAQLPPRDER